MYEDHQRRERERGRRARRREGRSLSVCRATLTDGYQPPGGNGSTYTPRHTASLSVDARTACHGCSGALEAPIKSRRRATAVRSRPAGGLRRVHVGTSTGRRLSPECARRGTSVYWRDEMPPASVVRSTVPSSARRVCGKTFPCSSWLESMQTWTAQSHGVGLFVDRSGGVERDASWQQRPPAVCWQRTAADTSPARSRQNAVCP